jgi:hypothetical protein
VLCVVLHLNLMKSVSIKPQDLEAAFLPGYLFLMLGILE